MGKSILLAAPTGRAAQRLAEMTKREAKTIHRLLAFDPKTMRFRFDEQNPLEAEAIIVDETSTLDLFLAHSLVKAVPPHAQVLLVGDIDQLPSVGPGMILRDMISSEQIPVVRLTEVFKQAQKSHIITNANLIKLVSFPSDANHQVCRIGLPLFGGCRASIRSGEHSSSCQRVLAQVWH
jgi:exodeoxyribonuclease V alpha subunit